MSMRALFVMLAVAVVFVPAPAVAQQDGPVRACAGAAIGDDAFCRAVAQSAEALVPAVMLAAAGGNPVPGTASTLGMRLTSAPRWSLGARVTVARAQSPDVVERGSTRSLSVLPAAFALDGSVGVLPGWSPLPTVGGVASLDLLFAAAMVPLLGGTEYSGTGGWSWGVGARLGLLRESFTLPGVSLSGTYRQLRGLRLGDDELASSDSYISGGVSALGARATVSKSILLLNLTGGIGYDLVFGDLHLGYQSALGASRLTAEGARMERLSAFGNVSYTLMVLHFVLGAGWQAASPVVPGASTAPSWAPSSAFHGTFSLRLSI